MNSSLRDRAFQVKVTFGVPEKKKQPRQQREIKITNKQRNKRKQKNHLGAVKGKRKKGSLSVLIHFADKTVLMFEICA